MGGTAADGQGRARPLHPRVWVVTGKGGTGKTTLAATLGLVAARSGLRTLLVSAGGDGALPALLELPAGAGEGQRIYPVAERLSAFCIRPETSLAEYLARHLPLRGLGERLLRNRAFASFLEAAPGWRDLVSLGKLWDLEQQSEDGRYRFDRIVVDAPATGHGLSLLSTPGAVLEAVQIGPIHRQTEPIRAMLCDARRVQCVAVTLPEELPVRETVELAARLAEIGVALGPVIVNRCEPEVSAERIEPALEQLPLRGGPPLVRRESVRAALQFRARRCAQQSAWIGELAAKLTAPTWCVADLAEPLSGLEGVARLADLLQPQLADAPL